MFLPSPIVAEVKENEGHIVVQKFKSISVLFADIVGFSKLCLAIEPSVLIELLNYIFTKFDLIIKEAGGHRLRTIGDGYFAICGAPDMVENHQYKFAKAALAMQEDIILPKHIKQELPEDTVLHIRIGLHCGEAVCGMVGGLEKWQYDAYGDTINTASRMESHGEPGKIHISEDFKIALTGYDEFTFTPREPMFIKGKGLMNTYFLQ
jgi:class 3 adenylate cyclase